MEVEALVDTGAKVNQMEWMGHAALLRAEVMLGLSIGDGI